MQMDTHEPEVQNVNPANASRLGSQSPAKDASLPIVQFPDEEDELADTQTHQVQVTMTKDML